MSSSPENVLNWDAIGVGASTLCMIHCVLTPILLAFAPAMAHFLPGGEFVHRSLAYVITGVGVLAFRAGYAVHRRKSVLLLLLAGIAAITVGAYAVPLLPSHLWEIAITVAGSALLITAHFRNRTMCRSCRTCSAPTENGRPNCGGSLS